MAFSYPTKQSFVQAEASVANATPSTLGDAFTTEEIQRAVDPLSCGFNPTREYAHCEIGSLIPGPSAVTFFGRIVNFHVHYGRSKSHAAAAGWHNLIVKDDTGAIFVKLYFANKPYTLKLGLLVTVWTTYVGYISTNDKIIAIGSVPNTTSIFPGREASVHIVIHRKSADTCRAPLGYSIGKPLPNLMNLKSFLDGGNEILGARILVCVKCINPQKSITSKKGPISVLTEVILFDDTSFITLKLWGDIGISAKDWKPSETILLIYQPSCRAEFRGGTSICLTQSSQIDINPEIPDAKWLQRYATELSRAENASQKFPEGFWDVEVTINANVRVLFNIADIDALSSGPALVALKATGEADTYESVRSEPWGYHTGFLNLTIMGVQLALYSQRNMLMCSQCCGKPMYANESALKCKSCDKETHLYLNPDIIGMLVDETGCIAPGKLLWSEVAWEGLFGHPIKEIIAADNFLLEWIEQRLVFMRVHFIFGWADEVGKLSILAVKM